ncbi:MAG: Bax inhibitor-1/YccA family protein [Bacteroidetes bacterium]|nr:Bax inhibitor-1/YccA family protein [Bacteroidales bacterium]MBU1009072.1 Bax inhibitor-1/YccA family protein [Bacteroidota bacterium]
MNAIQNPFGSSTEFQSHTLARTFMANVFSRMFMALAVTAAIAYLASGSSSFMSLMISQTGGMSLLGWVIMFSPLGLVFWMSAGFNRMSAATMSIVFALYSVLMGLSLSFIFLAYTGGSIAKTFVIASAMFGLMAVLGYTTKTDLTKFGSLMFMGLIGLVIASLVNFFMKSSMLEYIISFIGVLVFTGLTAYDVQKLKRLGATAMEQGDSMAKITIMGALTLYLDFINLFLFLLRFFGNRR